MNRDQILDWTKRGIDCSEEFCDKMNVIRDEIMKELPPDLKLAGKKAICDGMAVEKAISMETLLGLCREAAVRRGEREEF